MPGEDRIHAGDDHGRDAGRAFSVANTGCPMSTGELEHRRSADDHVTSAKLCEEWPEPPVAQSLTLVLVDGVHHRPHRPIGSALSGRMSRRDAVPRHGIASRSPEARSPGRLAVPFPGTRSHDAAWAVETRPISRASEVSAFTHDRSASRYASRLPEREVTTVTAATMTDTVSSAEGRPSDPGITAGAVCTHGVPQSSAKRWSDTAAITTSPVRATVFAGH